MTEARIKAGSLVLYKIRPALVESAADKIEIRFADGKSKRVRDKDVHLLHPGPVKSLGALDVEEEPDAKANVEKAEAMLKELGIKVKETIIRVGNPVDEIIEAGPDYSLIVVSESGKSGLQRFFMGSVAFKVMENAHNSVMIIR